MYSTKMTTPKDRFLRVFFAYRAFIALAGVGTGVACLINSFQVFSVFHTLSFFFAGAYQTYLTYKPSAAKQKRNWIVFEILSTLVVAGMCILSFIMGRILGPSLTEVEVLSKDDVSTKEKKLLLTSGLVFSSIVLCKLLD